MKKINWQTQKNGILNDAGIFWKTQTLVCGVSGSQVSGSSAELWFLDPKFQVPAQNYVTLVRNNNSHSYISLRWQRRLWDICVTKHWYILKWNFPATLNEETRHGGSHLELLATKSWASFKEGLWAAFSGRRVWPWRNLDFDCVKIMTKKVENQWEYLSPLQKLR